MSSMSKKQIKMKTMKSLEMDPCETCLYSENRNQHKVPSSVKESNKILPKQVFGKDVKKDVNKKGKVPQRSIPKGKVPKGKVPQRSIPKGSHRMPDGSIMKGTSHKKDKKSKKKY